MTEWFTCPSCGLEFGDPYAEETDGVIHGQCECGQVCEKPVEPLTDGGRAESNVAVAQQYAEAEDMLPFGEQLRDIRNTALAVVAAYRTDDPIPPGPEVKREHYWVTHDGDRYFGVRLSTGVGQAGHSDFEDACKFLEAPDNPIYEYDHVVTRIVPVEQTPIPYKIEDSVTVECPECDAWGQTHPWKLEDFLPEECPVCGYGGEMDVE